MPVSLAISVSVSILSVSWSVSMSVSFVVLWGCGALGEPTCTSMSRSSLAVQMCESFIPASWALRLLDDDATSIDWMNRIAGYLSCPWGSLADAEDRLLPLCPEGLVSCLWGSLGDAEAYLLPLCTTGFRSCLWGLLGDAEAPLLPRTILLVRLVGCCGGLSDAALHCRISIVPLGLVGRCRGLLVLPLGLLG